MSDYSNPGPIKTTNNISTKLISENTISDPLHPFDEHGGSINMSTSNDEGKVIAVVAKVKHTATENQAHWRHKQPHRHRAINQIVSDGDLMFHKKGTIMHFADLTRQVPIS